ncbi:MAG: histidinol-phosphate transaminase [Gammaproteobacteria bacterium]|nr:histidinol-phosphate transaminase [Gammaproteobacteria bacterium]
MTRPEPRPGIMDLTPYSQGKGSLPRFAEPIKLSSNESAHGPSPAALAAYHAAAGRLHRYPEGSHALLRAAIGETHGLDPRRIVCGNGSDEIISLLTRAYTGPGAEVLLSHNHFNMCFIHATTQGARVVLAPERDHVVDVDALLARVSPATRLVALANPNNPTGTYVPAVAIRRLHAALPPHVLLLLDGAYAEYVIHDDYDPGAALVEQADNVVMTRTFSKIYGLAGLRLGWAYCPAHIVDVLNRIRTPFNVNTAALAAATAAVRDRDYVSGIRAANARWLQRIGAELDALGLHVVPSATNFYLIDFDRSAPATARAAAAFLEARGIIPRPIGAGGGANVLRITVGRDHENKAVLAALRDYVNEVDGSAPPTRTAAGERG